jgi:hypothetical protein
MGFGDKLKGLRDQAQQAVAENKDKIQDAVQVVGDAANTKTHGKYANKIAKVGMKVEQSVDKIAAEGAEGDAAATGTAPAGDAGPAAAAPAPAAPAAAPSGESPAFEDHPSAHDDASTAPVTQEPANPVTPSAADEAASGFPEFS